jgi:hypothetical protein
MAGGYLSNIRDDASSPKEDGGWCFPNIGTKCRTLLYNRIQMLREREGTVLSEQIRNCDPYCTLTNPPYIARINPKLVNIQKVMDMAYIPPYDAANTRKTFKKRVYDVLKRIEPAKHSTPEVRIVQK